MVRILFFILLFVFVSIVSEAQNRNSYVMDIYEYNEQLENLVDRVIDSLGGKEANLEIKSYKSNGEIAYQSGTKSVFDLFYLKENWVRIDQKSEEDYHFFSRHGRRGWEKKMSREGSQEKKFRGKELDEEEQFHFYKNNLFDFEKKRLEIYYEGEVKMGDMTVEVIRLSGFGFGEEMYFISKETYRPVMKQVYILDGNYQVVINYTIKDYMKIGKVWLPKKLGVKRGDDVKEIDFFGYDLTASFDRDFFVKK